MEIDWSTAEVLAPPEEKSCRLRVTLRGRADAAFHEAFEAEAAHLKRGLGTERHNVENYMSGGDQWGIEVWPIDPRDVRLERQVLEEFVERVNRRAAPDRAQREAEDRRRKQEEEARAAQAKDLTERFRSEG